MNEKLEKLNQKIEGTEKKLRWAQLYTGRAGALRPVGSPLQGADDFRRFSTCSNHHRGSFTSPALAAVSYSFVGKHLALQAVPVQQVYNSSIPNSGRLWYNKVNDKLEVMEAICL